MKTNNMKNTTKMSTFDAAWLVGLLESDGCFFIDQARTCGMKISLTERDVRTLIHVKKLFGVGKIERTSDGMVTYRIRSQRVLQSHVFPILDTTPFLTHKYKDYRKLRQFVDGIPLPDWDWSYGLSPYWLHILGQTGYHNFLAGEKLDRDHLVRLFVKGWIAGFIQGDGSFYITKKGVDRYAHGFGVTQKDAFFLLEGLRQFFKIRAHVKKHASSNHVWVLDTTNSRNIQTIKGFFQGCFQGLPSLRFRIWSRTLGVDSVNDTEKLIAAQLQMRRLLKATS